MARPRASVILSLDVSSSSTGYAVLRDGRWVCNDKNYGLIKISNKLSLSKRLVSFRNSLAALIREVKPTHIVIEDVFSGRNVATMKLLARFNGVAIEVCRRLLRHDPQIALTAEVRSFLGCGRSKKEAFDFICTKFNLDWSFNKYNDVTDALALAMYSYYTLTVC